MAPALFEISYTLITVVLLSFFLYTSHNRTWGVGRQILWWVLFGTIFNLYSMSWLYTVYPLVWMPSGLVQIFGIMLLHIILSVASGVCFCVVGYTISQNVNAYIKPILIGFSFVLAEVLRSLIISLLYLGGGTTVDLHFNAGTLGNALSTTPLVELAYYGGTFSLTFFLTYVLYSIISLPFRKGCVHLGLILLILALTHFYAPVRLPSRELTIGVITTDVPTVGDSLTQKTMLSSNEKIVDLITTKSSYEDILVLPEDARFISSLSTTSKILFLKQHPKTLVIDGDTMLQEGKLANLSVFLETESGKTALRGKELLLPFNEYIPYFFDSIFRVIMTEDLSHYAARHSYIPIYSGKSVLYGDVRVGTIICSEMLSFSVLQELDQEGPSIVFYQSRLNVFNNNPWFLMHLRSFSKVAAAQLRTTIISSNNYAPSYIIDTRGTIVGELPTSTSYSTVTLSKNGKVILKNN